MATSITNAFITQFEAEVHMAYQRMGSKLKNLVRQVNGVNGNTVKFQKIAKGSANTKARHAEVVAMDLAHSNVSATLDDFYAADYVDKLDELKVNIDERQVVALSAAYATIPPSPILGLTPCAASRRSPGTRSSWCRPPPSRRWRSRGSPPSRARGSTSPCTAASCTS